MIRPRNHQNRDIDSANDNLRMVYQHHSNSDTSSGNTRGGTYYIIWAMHFLARRRDGDVFFTSCMPDRLSFNDLRTPFSSLQEIVRPKGKVWDRETLFLRKRIPTCWFFLFLIFLRTAYQKRIFGLEVLFIGCGYIRFGEKRLVS